MRNTIGNNVWNRGSFSHAPRFQVRHALAIPAIVALVFILLFIFALKTW
jgi:hypothetical protein